MGGNAAKAVRVSVVVPTCNRAEALGRALASIRALENDDLSIEIIVGDNGDCPLTPQVAATHGAIHVRSTVRGASASRNAAMGAATGDFIAFLDDDDGWLPEHVRPHLALLAERPDLDGVIGQVRLADEALHPMQGMADWPVEHPGEGDDLIRRMLSGYFPQIGTCVVRASVRESSGPFDEALIGGEDLDWLMRLSGRHALGFVETPCILFSQRKTGDFDALQRLRINFDRKVFWRHAHKRWRVWRSPLEYMRAYSGTLAHFFTYFSEVSLIAAMNGQRLRALGAIRTSIGILPLRAIRHLFSDSPLRQALVTALFVWQSPHRVPLPLWLAILHI